VEFAEGRILRPLLSTTRAEVEGYLGALGQRWREDSSNRQLTFTRNRIRHELLPLLEGWNPRLREHLAQMAELARGEEAWWAAELERLAPQVLLHGRAVRGGGRASSDDVALEIARLSALAPALQRRLIRFAAEELGAELDFPATEALLALALSGRAGQRVELAQGLRGERSQRELRLAVAPVGSVGQVVAEFKVTIPGEVAGLGVRLRIEGSEPANADASRTATLRNWKPGDRVWLRHSSGPRKVKEVLERLHVTGSSRALWPVLEVDGRIIWMQGVEVEPMPGIRIRTISMEDGDAVP
jgi:tRNA(Ile)-lysidine synthase